MADFTQEEIKFIESLVRAARKAPHCETCALKLAYLAEKLALLKERLH